MSHTGEAATTSTLPQAPTQPKSPRTAIILAETPVGMWPPPEVKMQSQNVLATEVPSTSGQVVQHQKWIWIYKSK